MFYRILADIVVVVHFSFVLFVLFGGILALKWKRLVWLHVPAFLWGSLIEFLGWLCPLTHLEYWLTEKAGAVPYQSGFIEYYIVPLLYPAVLTRELQILFGFFVIAVNVIVYGCLLWRSYRGAASPD